MIVVAFAWMVSGEMSLGWGCRICFGMGRGSGVGGSVVVVGLCRG